MSRNSMTFAESAWAAVVAVVAGFARLIPHPWNLTPMGAVGIFGGSRLPAWLAFTLPLGILAASDAVIYAWKGWSPFNPVVYASFLVYVLLGYFLLRKPTALKVVGVSLLGSLQFFLLTNFAIWLTASVPAADLGGLASAWVPSNHADYPQLLRYSFDLSGLLACYVLALPFYGGTLAGDLVYPLVLFGVHRWLIEPAGDAAPVAAVPVEVRR